MDENNSVIGVLAEVDRAVLDHPERRADVGELLWPYRVRTGDAAGWFTELETWAKGRTPTELDFWSVDEALDDLRTGMPDIGRPAPRVEADDLAPDRDRAEEGSALASRRERALLALVAARPERFGPGAPEHDRVVAALSPVMPGESGDGAEQRLRQPVRRVQVHSSYDSGLVMKPVSPGNDDPVPYFVTESNPLNGQTLQGVAEFLDPVQWTLLAEAFWGPMKQVDGFGDQFGGDDERRCFRETFNVTPNLALQPILEFIRRPLSSQPRARALEYRLCDHREHYDAHQDDFQNRNGLTYDEGAIVNNERIDGLTVMTTKRVGFTGLLNGPALAMVAEALGYQAVFEDMIRKALGLTDPTASGRDQL